MSDIFISYASEDGAETEKLAYALQSQGWSVWWDRSIPIGKSYEAVIEEALDEARCVIVIWSKISVKSEWVRAEAGEAQRQGKLFPINIDGSIPPLVYRALQTADFKGWSGAATDAVFKQLAAAILGHIGSPDSKPETAFEIKDETTTPKISSSQSSPPESPTIFTVKQTDEENLTGGNVRTGSAITSSNEQPAPNQNKQSKNKWIASVSVLLLLTLLVGAIFIAINNFDFKSAEKVSSVSNNTDGKIDSGVPDIATVPVATRKKSKSIEPEMVTIPKGCFQMGSPETDQDRYDNERQHQVCVDAFKIGKFEVSFEEYQQFCDVTSGCQKPDDQGWGRGNRPVINVSWEDAIAYAEWLSNKTGKRYRLPTEAEWEYAARANKQPQTI